MWAPERKDVAFKKQSLQGGPGIGGQGAGGHGGPHGTGMHVFQEKQVMSPSDETGHVGSLVKDLVVQQEFNTEAKIVSCHYLAHAVRCRRAR